MFCIVIFQVITTSYFGFANNTEKEIEKCKLFNSILLRKNN